MNYPLEISTTKRKTSFTFYLLLTKPYKYPSKFEILAINLSNVIFSASVRTLPYYAVDNNNDNNKY